MSEDGPAGENGARERGHYFGMWNGQGAGNGICMKDEGDREEASLSGLSLGRSTLR